MKKLRTGACLVLLLTLLCALPGATALATARAKGLALAPASMTLYVGSDGPVDTRQLLAVVKPATATAPLRYRTSKASVAQVDAAGLVTPVKPGTAQILCQTTDGSKLQRISRVTVKGVAPTAVSLTPAALTLAPNAKATLTTVIAPANAYNKSVVWTSSDPTIAKVTQAGVVTGVKRGSATIRAKTIAGGLVASTVVTVDFGEASIYYIAIGQENYLSQTKLVACINDAQRFEAALMNANFGHVSTTGRVYADLTGAGLRQALSSLPSTYGMTERDITYVYYSGHGAGDKNGAQFTKAERGALVGVEFGGANRATALVTVDEVRGYLDAVPGTVVVILDCCYAGQYVTAKAATGADAQAEQAIAREVVDVFRASPANVTGKGTHSLVDVNVMKSKYKVLVAAKPLQESYVTSGKNSLFTRYLCQAAGIGGADDTRNDIIVTDSLPGDANGNGYLSIKELFTYVSPRVLKWCKLVNTQPQQMVTWPVGDSYPIFARVQN